MYIKLLVFLTVLWWVVRSDINLIVTLNIIHDIIIDSRKLDMLSFRRWGHECWVYSTGHMDYLFNLYYKIILLNITTNYGFLRTCSGYINYSN